MLDRIQGEGRGTTGAVGPEATAGSQDRATPVTGGGFPGDAAIARRIWPLLLASAVGMLPFTVFGTFLVPIAEAAESDVATVGGLRGLSGIAALVVGTGLAPLVDRMPRLRLAGVALLAIGAANLLGVVGDVFVIAIFCLLVGAATAVLNPAVTAGAADVFPSSAAAGRAATMVTATQSLTAMLAAPVIAFPAVLWGWRGDLVAVSVLAIVAALVLFRRAGRGDDVRPATSRPGYVASFRRLSGMPGVVPLLLVGFFRTAAFMGYLAYLAPLYSERFELEPEVFAFVWTLSGASFFLGNYVSGRWVNAGSELRRPRRTLPLAVMVALVACVGLYGTSQLVMALVLTSVLGLSHAVVAACVVSLLVYRSEDQRGTALSLNAAGMSFGVFVGAALGGVGLGLAGWAGVATAFGLLTVGALVAALLGVREGSGGRPSLT